MGTMRQLCLAKLDLVHRDWVLDPEQPIDGYLEDRLSNYQLKLKTRPDPSPATLAIFLVVPLAMLQGYPINGRKCRCRCLYAQEEAFSIQRPVVPSECILAKGIPKIRQLFMAFMGRAPKSDALRRDAFFIKGIKPEHI